MNPLLIAPFLLYTMGGVIALLWYATRRDNPHLALIAAGFLFFATAIASQILHIPESNASNAVVSAVFYGIGTMLVALGVIARSKLTGGILPLSTLTALLIIGIAWYSYADYDLNLRIYILNFGMGLILLYAAWRIRENIHGSTADKILFWSLLGVSLHFFPRTILTIGTTIRAPGVAFSDTIFWIFSIYVMGIMTILMGIAIIVVTGLDAIASIQKERDTDPLTNIGNRRMLDRTIKNMSHKKQRYSLILCDIDNFKTINDTYGHETGDLVLQYFVQELVATVGPNDIVTRFGGEEFVIIRPHAGLEDTRHLAELIRLAQPKMSMPSMASALSVTCSMGVVEVGLDENPWDAINRADKLLYKAKQAGRNRIESDPARTLKLAI